MHILAALIFASLPNWVTPTTSGQVAKLSPSDKVVRLDLENPPRMGRVFFFTNSQDPTPTVKRLKSLGYEVRISRDPSSINVDTLCAYNLLFIDVGSDSLLFQFSDEIENYLGAGGGLILSQLDMVGYFDFLPPGFEFLVESNKWPEWPYPSGTSIVTGGHPLTALIENEDLSGNFDMVPIEGLGSSWEILAVDEDHQELATVLTGSYGEGKIVFYTGNLSPLSLQPGTDRFVKAIVEWVKNDGCNPTEVKGNVSIGKPLIEKIWPNPTRGEIRLSLGSVRVGAPIVLSVYDRLGRLLYRNSFLPESQILKLDLKEAEVIPNQILFIEVKQAEESYSVPVYYRR